MKAFCILFISLLALLANLQGTAAERPAKLNVLLIMADDLRDYGGAFSRDMLKTPNLDRLRARGITFERAYVQYPVCNPSRSSMMAGLRAEQTGVVNNTVRLRQRMPDIITMPQLCKDAGWQSHAFGKLYHLGGGKDAKQKALWADAGRSWHTAQDYNPNSMITTMTRRRSTMSPRRIPSSSSGLRPVSNPSRLTHPLHESDCLLNTPANKSPNCHHMRAIRQQPTHIIHRS